MKCYLIGGNQRCIVDCKTDEEAVTKFIKKFYDEKDDRFKVGMPISICERGFYDYDPDNKETRLMSCQVQ